MTKQQTKALIKEKDFQVLADLLPDFIGKYEVDGRIVYLNERLREALQISLEEALGKTPSSLWPDGRYALYEKKIVDCARTGEADYLDLQVTDVRTGGMEYHHIRFVAERDVEGQIIAVIAFGRDMTKRILLEQQLTASSRMASLGEMAGCVAHEINNPLAIIYGRLRQIERMVHKENFNKDNFLKLTGDIEKTVNRISRIIKGLKTFSREGSKDPFDFEPIQEVLKDALSFCEQRILNSGIQLKLRGLFDAAPLMVECRSTDISQVIVNLLNNSFDAVNDSSKAWIEVELSDLGNKVEISVTDSGLGIPLEYQSSIMHPFFTTKPVGKGTGLGLSLSKGIIDGHKGQFYLDTKSPHTKFVIRLFKKRPQE